MKDPYEILGLKRGVPFDDARKAYRRLARELHPDSDPGNPWAEDEFKELSAAYEMLAKADRRARDAEENRRRAEAARRQTEAEAKAAGRKSTARPKIKGADVEYVLRVDFLDAAKGAVRHITMANGKRLKVSVPAGTEHGRVLRLKGQGMAGIGGGADGDAHVEILVDPHPVFRRDGADIHVEVPVTLPEAVLGGRIDAPTIDGTVTVTVPKGSNTGSRLRLRGKGLKGGNGDGRGDQFVHLRVVLPSKPDADLVHFLEDWAPKHRYRVRGKEA